MQHFTRFFFSPYAYSHTYMICMMINVECGSEINIYRMKKECLEGKTTIIKTPQTKTCLQMPKLLFFHVKCFRGFRVTKQKFVFLPTDFYSSDMLIIYCFGIFLIYINTPETSSLKLINGKALHQVAIKFHNHELGCQSEK